MPSRLVSSFHLYLVKDDALDQVGDCKVYLRLSDELF